MATHSSVLALRIPGTGEPGGLPSIGSHRVGHDRSDLAAAATAGTSLVVQWLRLHTPQGKGPGFNPWSGKIPHTMEELSPCATTTEPALYGLLLLLLLSHFSWVQLCATP